MFPSMRITWRRAWSAEPERNDVSWEQIVSVLQANSALTYTPNPDPKLKPLDLPLIAFGHFYGGYKREQLDPAGLSAIALDYDDTPAEEFQRVLLKAQSEGPGFAHTTWLHGIKGAQGNVRARLILPLDPQSDTPVSVAEWPFSWETIAGLYNAPGLDHSCKNPERCYFVPATNPSSPWPCWTEVW